MPDEVPLAEVEARMRPGRMSQKGFLGEHERLTEVLSGDAATLTELGLTPDLLTERLEALLEPALLSRQSVIRIGHHRVRLERYKGRQSCPFAPEPHLNPCPFGRGTKYGSVDWRIRNERSGIELTGPGLIVHLIGAHGFFEGLQSPYRVDPRALAGLLEVGPPGG